MSVDEQGPPVHVEDEEPERRRDDRRVVQAVAVLLLLAFVACLCWWLYTQMVRVPDLRGMTLEKARAALERVGLEVGVLSERKGLASEVGGIVSQTPEAGSRVMRGTKIDLAVAVSGEAAPGFVGGEPVTPGAEEGESLFPEPETPSDVTTTDVRPSSGGPTGPRIPLVMGGSLSAAGSKLVAESYVLGHVSYGPSTNDLAKGIVFHQDPAPGTYAPHGTVVDVWVSTGPPTQGWEYPSPGD